jgi:hypothetical protein
MMTTEDRIARLEQRARTQNRITAAACLVAVLAVAVGMAPRGADEKTLHASGIVLTDPDSDLRIELGFEGEPGPSRRGYIKQFHKQDAVGEMVFTGDTSFFKQGRMLHIANRDDAVIGFGDWVLSPQSVTLKNSDGAEVLLMGTNPLGDASLVLKDREGGQAVVATVVSNSQTGDRAGAIATYDTKDPLIQKRVAPFIED